MGRNKYRIAIKDRAAFAYAHEVRMSFIPRVGEYLEGGWVGLLADERQDYVVTEVVYRCDEFDAHIYVRTADVDTRNF